MNIRTAFPTKYISAKDLPGPARVTIRHVEMETIKSSDGDKKLPVIYFQGKEKGLVLNLTNGCSIEELHGGETNNWTGKEIVLFPTTTQFGRDIVDCVRIRAVDPPQQTAPPSAAPAQPYPPVAPPTTVAPPPEGDAIPF